MVASNSSKKIKKRRLLLGGGRLESGPRDYGLALREYTYLEFRRWGATARIARCDPNQAVREFCVYELCLVMLCGAN